MGIVGTAVSNNPQKGYDQLLTAPEPPFRTAPDAPRRSCLAHEARDISRRTGRRQGVGCKFPALSDQVSAEPGRAPPARLPPRRRRAQIAQSRPAAKARSRRRPPAGSSRLELRRRCRLDARPVPELLRETRLDRAPAAVRAHIRGLRGRRVRAQNAAPTA